MAQIDTSIYRGSFGPTMAQALGGTANTLRNIKQANLSDLAMKQQEFNYQQSVIEAQRKEQERKRQEEEFKRQEMLREQEEAKRQEFLAQYQTQQMEGEEQLSPEQLQGIYANVYPEKFAEMQMKNVGKSSSQWVAVPGRPGWQMNKATGEYKKSDEVFGDIDPYKQSIIQNKKDRLEESKKRRLQDEEQHDEKFLLSRMKYDTQLEEIKNTRGDKIFNQTNKLADQHYKKSIDFIKQRDAYDRIQASAEDPSAAGDLALIFNYMKVLDPGSTVREGEFANAENAGSVDERTRAWYNKIKSGQRLSVTQRADFVDRTEKLYSKAQANQDKLDKSYRTKAKLFKLDPALILYDYGSANSGAMSAVQRYKKRKGK